MADHKNMNTIIRYMYRDGSNYKNFMHAIVKGEITDEGREVIAKSLDDCGYFIPQQVGLPDAHFKGYPLSEDDHCWCTLQVTPPSDEDYDPNVPDDLTLTNDEPTLDMTIEELVEAFRKAEGAWDQDNYAIVYERTINDAINKAIIDGSWHVAPDEPATVEIVYTCYDGIPDTLSHTLTEKNKRQELVRFWEANKHKLWTEVVDEVRVIHA